MLGLLLVAATICPPGDLALGHRVAGAGLRGDPGVVTAASSVGEGTIWDTPRQRLSADANCGVA